MNRAPTTMLVFVSLTHGIVGFSCHGIAGVESAPETILFEDRFEGKRADGWTRLRENPDTWRLRDGAAGRFTNDDAANQLLGDEYRKGGSLEG